MPEIPVFDFHSPWVALIQLALFWLLPWLTGLLTDRYTSAKVKIAVLGVSTVLASALTWLLDVALADGWATLDWAALVEVIVNAALTFALANAVHRGVNVPTGIAAAAQESNVIQLFKADPARIPARAA